MRQAAFVPLVGPVASQPADSGGDFIMPAEAERLTLMVEWTPVQGGAAHLSVVLTTPPDDDSLFGATETYAEAAGASPLLLEAELDGGTPLRFTVYPHEDPGVVLEQPFHVRLDFS